MASIDQQFVEYIVKTLVNNPEKVNVTRTIDEKGVLLELTVDPEDVGRVIGRRGATAQSIRTLLRALGTKNDARYNLKIINTDEEYVPRPSTYADSESDEPVSIETETEEIVEEDYTEPEDSEEEDSGEDESAEDSSDDLAEKTRAELADLDDLDI